MGGWVGVLGRRPLPARTGSLPEVVPRPPPPSPIAVMLFMAYSSFTGFVTVWRDILLPPPMAGQETGGLPPPAGFGAAATYGGDAGYGGGAGADAEPYADSGAGGAAPL